MEKLLLPCRVTDAELTGLANDMAGLLSAIDGAEERGRSDRAALKAELEALHEKLNLIARQVRSRTIEREVDVDDMPDYPRNKVCRVRQDTGEVISERDMRPDERQLSLVPEPRKVVSFAQPGGASGSAEPPAPPSPKHWADTERGEEGLTDDEIERAEQEMRDLTAPVEPVDPDDPDPDKRPIF